MTFSLRDRLWTLDTSHIHWQNLLHVLRVGWHPARFGHVPEHRWAAQHFGGDVLTSMQKVLSNEKRGSKRNKSDLFRLYSVDAGDDHRSGRLLPMGAMELFWRLLLLLHHTDHHRFWWLCCTAKRVGSSIQTGVRHFFTGFHLIRPQCSICRYQLACTQVFGSISLM